MSCPVHLPAGEHPASGFQFSSRNLPWVGSCGYFGSAAGQTWVMLLPKHPCSSLAQYVAPPDICLPAFMLICVIGKLQLSGNLYLRWIRRKQPSLPVQEMNQVANTQ